MSQIISLIIINILVSIIKVDHESELTNLLNSELTCKSEVLRIFYDFLSAAYQSLKIFLVFFL